MLELAFSYLIFNLVAGLVLTPFHLVKQGGKMPVENILWLLFLPAIGLGKWQYDKEVLTGQIPEYPTKWFRYKYMVKLNWVYIGLIALIPFLGIVLLSFGLAIGSLGSFGSTDWGSISDITSLLEVGLFFVFILYVIVMFIVLIIPYLVLIHVPKHEMRIIEKSILMKKTKQKAQSQAAGELLVQLTKGKRASLFPQVDAYVKDCLAQFDTIDKERKRTLEDVAKFIRTQLAAGDMVNLTFICTHNSRRSQFGQIWAAVAAAHFGIRNVQTFSGGTEETAFNKRAVQSVLRTGMTASGTVGTNPRYSVRFSDELGALDCYSKTFDNPVNPQKGFAAIMTCSDADENCPVVSGAVYRARVTYEDPKVSDNTLQETATYDERCRQIATEMLYLFSKV
jgi:protein-tyrosine-phosphatase/uncharacterized membrane protein